MAESTQLFLEYKLNFNLHKPKALRPTLIYAVIYFRKKQYKISTGVKVYPNQWNPKKQIATISNGQSKLDNYNNGIVNDKLKQILLSFEQSKAYLCEHIESLSDFYEIIKKYINPNMISKRKKIESSVPATTQMQLLLSEVEKDSTRDIYKGNINLFKQFLIEKKIPDTWSSITSENLEEYKNYLNSGTRTVTSVNNCLSCLKIILKKADKAKEIDFNFYTSGCDKVDKIKDIRTREEKKSKQIPLTEKQVQALYNLKLKEKDTEVRDVFVVQCLLGQRISDMPKLFSGNYKVIDENTVEILIQKTGEKAVIYLFPIAKTILEKYKKTGFKHLKIMTSSDDKDNADRSYAGKINRRIKIICKNAGFNEKITYTEQRGKKKKTISKEFYELIHTHIARHTFITLMCKMGIDKETVKLATGHEDTKMIDEVYLHESSEDKARKLSGAIKDKAKGSLFVANNSQKPEFTEEEIDVFNYVFAGDLLLGINQKYEATKVHEVLDKDLDPGFLELPATKEAIAILKDTTRIGEIDIEKYKGNKELKKKVRGICTIIWEIGKAAHDILLIQFFQDNVITLGLNTEYYLPKTMSKRQIESLFNMKSYKGVIIA